MTTAGPVDTVGAWVARLEPAPPARLHARLQDLIAAHANRPVADAPDVLLEAGEQLLETLLRSGATSRDSALDLLAVDSLVTYAFQAAADDPARLVSRAISAMQRVAAIPTGVGLIPSSPPSPPDLTT